MRMKVFTENMQHASKTDFIVICLGIFCLCLKTYTKHILTPELIPLKSIKDIAKIKSSKAKLKCNLETRVDSSCSWRLCALCWFVTHLSTGNLFLDVTCLNFNMIGFLALENGFFRQLFIGPRCPIYGSWCPSVTPRLCADLTDNFARQRGTFFGHQSRHLILYYKIKFKLIMMMV